MKRVVLVTALVCLADAGAASPRSAPPPASKPTAATAGAGATWWCSAFADGEVGMCLPSLRECEQARSNIVAAKSEKDLPSKCAPQASAVCIRAQKIGGAAGTICHPNAAMCRARGDDIRWRHTKDMRVLSDCQTTPPAASAGSPAAPGSPEDAHWWCLSFDDGAMGSCDRSRVQCDKGHEFLRRRGAPQLSNCETKQTAICYQYIDAEGPHRLQCAPTMAICEAAKRMQKATPDGARLGYTDCHTVD